MQWIEQQIGAAVLGWLRPLRARTEGAATILSMRVVLRERRRTRVRVPKGA